MSKQTVSEKINTEVDESRRKFIEKAGKASVAAPAAAILLSGSMQSAYAYSDTSDGTGGDGGLTPGRG